MTTPKMSVSNSNGSHATRLDEIWTRLDAVCQKLWAEDRSSAVPLQAMIEEFRDEPQRVEKILESQQKTILEMQQTIKREFEADYRARVESLQQKLEHQTQRVAALEDELASMRKKSDLLVQKLEARESENLQLTENLIKNEAQKDASRAQKLQAAYEEISKKAEVLEKTLDERHRSLEAEHAKRTEELGRKHAELLEGLKTRAINLERELEAREVRCSQQEQSLHEREEALNSHAQELDNSYQQKRHELDQLKNKMQKEISFLVKEYQAKMAGGEKDA